MAGELGRMRPVGPERTKWGEARGNRSSALGLYSESMERWGRGVS